MLEKRTKVIMPASIVQDEVFRSMKVEVGSKTPYTDATQVSFAHQFLLLWGRVYAVALLYCYAALYNNTVEETSSSRNESPLQSDQLISVDLPAIKLARHT